MRKITPKVIFFAVCFMLIVPLPTFAGNWQNDNSKWKYQNDDGTYRKNNWLHENEAWYYFDSDGAMLTDTLSPDGIALDSDGKRILDTEILPLDYPGNEADYLAYLNEYTNFYDGIYLNFNTVYDEVLSSVLASDSDGGIENAITSIDRLYAYDFTPYFSSQYIGIRKTAMSNEIFKLEQIYYMRELVKALSSDDFDNIVKMLDKVSHSNDTYYNDFFALSNQMRVWDDF